MKNKVIVLVLGYKTIKYLDECISSLTKQTYKNFEIWFGDNNSNDGSVEYLNKNFPKIRTFQFKENSGYAGGNNKLIKKAFENEADLIFQDEVHGNLFEQIEQTMDLLFTKYIKAFL